ncbi:MAG: hypothetical protein AAFS10_25635, partial [Myxococcota bacterium]
RYAEAVGDASLQMLIETVGVVIPNLTLHRADKELAYEIPLNWLYVAFTCSYSLSYTVICLMVAILIFNRRDFV